MKRILAILSVALVGAAVPVFAADFYDNFANPNISITRADPNNQWSGVTTQVFSYGNYDVIRTQYDQDHPVAAYQDSFYRIRVTGDNVDLYLTDATDNVGGAYQRNALENKISKYGYTYVASADQSKVNTGNITTLNTSERVKVGESMESPWWHDDTSNNQSVITRYGYYLGTFQAGDEIEIYMQDSTGNFSKSNTQGFMGSYGDGVNFADTLVQYQRNVGWLEAKSVMPLAALDVGNGNRVFYGIYGETSGSPLPGGAAVYVVAGLLAFGFIVLRRRKAIAV